MNLYQLTTAELGKARDAANYLCGLRDHLEPILFIKLDTLRADLTAEAEDRATRERNGRRTSQAAPR